MAKNKSDKTPAESLTTNRALRVLKVEDIKTDPTYQREVKGKHRRIATEFDRDAFGVPVVGQRSDGTLWVVDGLQRITALRKMGMKTVRAEVFVSDGPEHEARVFTKINKNRVGLTASELFFAALSGGDEDAWLVKNTAEGLGFTIRKTATNSADHAANLLRCFGTLMQIVQRNGMPKGYEEKGSLLKATLSIIKECWPSDPMRVKADIVDGLRIWLVRHEGTADTERLIPRLNSSTPGRIMYSAGQGVGNRGNNVADTIEVLYRKRLKK